MVGLSEEDNQSREPGNSGRIGIHHSTSAQSHLSNAQVLMALGFLSPCRQIKKRTNVKRHLDNDHQSRRLVPVFLFALAPTSCVDANCSMPKNCVAQITETKHSATPTPSLARGPAASTVEETGPEESTPQSTGRQAARRQESRVLLIFSLQMPSRGFCPAAALQATITYLASRRWTEWHSRSLSK